MQMDSHVDRKYKEKYFPKSKGHKHKPSNAVATVVHLAHPPAMAGGSDTKSPSVSEVGASFAKFSITAAPAPLKGMQQPPCPMADLPREVLSHIMQEVALADVRDFVRLAQVCKRFAYLVATDSSVWRCVCESAEFGFPGMHYRFARAIRWEPLQEEPYFELHHDKGTMVNKAVQWEVREARGLETSRTLLERCYSGSWKTMFRNRPRIRFGGVYISTVNYWRSGQAWPDQYAWSSPVHIVTYYRYLRFFRDGTLISLLTTHAPAEVVPHLTRSNVELHATGAAPHLPSAVVAGAYKGRWKLGCLWDDLIESEGEGRDASAGVEQAEANIFIETEGVGKYTYELGLVMRNAGRSRRNNKLVWRSFCSYNRLTDDRGDFGLKNDKPFFFSRVGSYGIGE